VVHRAMKRIEEPAGLGWLADELRGCVEPVLSQLARPPASLAACRS